MNGKLFYTLVRLAFCTVVGIAIYASITTNIYRFRHPDYSQTQLFLHSWDAMTFKR